MTDKIEILEAVIAAADEAVLRSRSGSSAESAFNRFAALLENKLKEWREEEEKEERALLLETKLKEWCEEEEKEEANYQELLREFGTNGNGHE